MEGKTGQSRKGQHDVVKEKYDEVQSDGRYEEGMARMAVYHRHCQDPVIFRTLGNVRGKSLLDLACGDGFYTRRFRSECGTDPVLGIDLSPKQIDRARSIEQREPLGIEYRVGDVTTLELRRWPRAFINNIAADVGFTAEWHEPFISTEGLETYGAGFFENYLANPQSKLLRLTRTV